MSRKHTSPIFQRDESTPLLTEPQNQITQRIFVAATRQNDGKTTTSLGLYGALRRRFPNIGYIKPVGQRFVEVDGFRVDEDTHLLNSIYNTDIPIEAMSPITIDGSFTRRFLHNPDEMLAQLVDRLCRGFDRATYGKEVVIIEGSGHAGVGAVFDLSNAQVAKILKAKAVIVSQGGIGKPIDEIALNKALFDKHGVEVVGAVLNKVLPDKMDYIAEYAARGLKRLGVPLLGVLPIQKELTAPNLGQIVDEVKGRWINGRSVGQVARVLRVVIGAMTAKSVVDYLQLGVLIICPGDRDDILLAVMAARANEPGSDPCSGIILTRNMMPHPKLMEMLSRTEIPVAICADDSYDVASKITSMVVKTQPEDEDKIPIIQNLISEHVDLDKLIGAF